MTSLKKWHNEFKTLGLKENFFLNILNNNLSNIEPFYTKRGLWIESFRFSNSLCAWVITNHASIGACWLYFFPREEFSCLCGLYSIKTRYYIPYNCKRFNKGWNLEKKLSSNSYYFWNITWMSLQYCCSYSIVYTFFFSFYLVLFYFISFSFSTI